MEQETKNKEEGRTGGERPSVIIAFDPLLLQPGSPKVQKLLRATIDEETLRRFFPEDTWLHDETYLMGLYEATLENLEQFASTRDSKMKKCEFLPSSPLL